MANLEVSCEEIGHDCGFVARGETMEEVLNTLIRHLCSIHDIDWFDLEDVYAAARERIHRKVA
jgi:predicted small metal-binding protein